MKLGSRDSRNLIIITKYFVPVNVVDSNSVYDLCDKLLRHDENLNIHIVTTALKYKSNIKLRDFDNSLLEKLNIQKIEPFFFFNHSGLFRVINDLIAGLRLVLHAKKLKIQTVISLSNPPLINTWCSLLLRKNNYVYWSFDLYPEALYADGILRKNSFFGRFLTILTYFNSPSAIIALGSKQFEYLVSCYSNKNIGKLILPCGIHDNVVSKSIPEWRSTEKIILGYIGNIGKAHSKDFLINVIKTIKNFTEFKLVVSVYGEYSQEVILLIKKLEFGSNVQIIDHVNQNQLGYIDIHLVSLLDHWTNISVPSKAVSAVCSKSALWFNGSKECDTFNFFEKCSYFSESNEDSISYVLSNITVVDLLSKKVAANIIADELFELEDNTIRQIGKLSCS